MRLKKITLLGFKSFADKTVLHFDAGITCIVGPNGCGKSNIADAFRWVLGEQSAKSMRGTKMPDIIFAGTTHRKPLNFAEVSLTLTDIQGALPIDYEELTITRRLHRSGESEYFINQQPTRLKDIHALLLDSGIGRNAFSIFEQGKLDQVISYSPAERRYIFEEAAGILRFLQRKKEALKRLEQADLNLSRVVDIHSEVAKQIQTLENQAQKAVKFKKNKEELEQLEKTSYLLRWRVLDKKRVDLDQKLEKQKIQLQTIQTQAKEALEQQHQFKQQVQQQENKRQEQHEKVLKLRHQQELHTHDCQTAQRQLQSTQQRTEKLKKEEIELQSSQQADQQTKKSVQQKLNTLETDWSAAEKNWIHQQQDVKGKENKVNQLRQEMIQQQQAHVKGIQQESHLQSEWKQAEVRLENSGLHKQRLEERQQQLSQDKQHFSQIIQDKKQQLQKVLTQVDSYKNNLKSFEEELKQKKQKQEESQKERENLRKKLAEVKARHTVLTRMREDHEGFSSGSKRLLEEAQNPKSPLYQTIRPFYEYFTPQTEVIEAIAIALRHYAHTFVVEHAHDFQKVMAFAQQANLQDYSLFCLEWLKTVPAKQTDSPSLSDKLASNSSLAQHFLQEIAYETSLQATLDGWQKSQFKEGWSIEQGLFVDQRGVLFKIKPSTNQVFLRESELKKLEKELIGHTTQLEECEQLLQTIQQRSTQLQNERAEIDQVLRKEEMKLVEVNFGLQRALGDQQKAEADQIQSQKECAHLEEQLEQQKQLVQKLAQQHAALKQTVIRCQQEKEALQKELEKEEGTLRLQQQDQKQKGSVYHQLSTDRQHLFHQLNLMDVKEQEYEKQKQRLKVEKEETEKQQLKVTQEEQKGREQLVQIEAQLQTALQQEKELEQQKAKGMEQLAQADQQVLQQQNKLKQLEQECANLTLQLTHQQTNLQNVQVELEERYQLTIEEVQQLNLFADRPLEQVEKQIRSLRHTLQEAGDVNLTAIEELEKHQVRQTFLKTQLDDMQVAKQELLGIIQQLDKESRQVFQETFELIRANFKKNFQILFNGGEADLQFTDAQDVLEAGIEISAKPPGKQMRSISLLSGGEKCLTAVALLFAIFEVKPAPFCILDEIDAPLDDTNVERFVNVVKHFIDRCQFLIVTHNKRTMAIGDILFGVSMEEKGVSKLLTLEFAHAQQEEAQTVLVEN